jgi:hypothetical protein
MTNKVINCAPMPIESMHAKTNNHFPVLDTVSLHPTRTGMQSTYGRID